MWIFRRSEVYKPISHSDRNNILLLQINLDHYNRGNISRDLASDGGTTRDLFVGAQKYIFNIIENDSFVRFVHSKHFEACQTSVRRNPRTILRNIFPSRRTQQRPVSQDD